MAGDPLQILNEARDARETLKVIEAMCSDKLERGTEEPQFVYLVLLAARSGHELMESID